MVEEVPYESATTKNRNSAVRHERAGKWTRLLRTFARLAMRLVLLVAVRDVVDLAVLFVALEAVVENNILAVLCERMWNQRRLQEAMT